MQLTIPFWMRQAGQLQVIQHSKDIVTNQIQAGTFLLILNLANGWEVDGTDLPGRLVQGCKIFHLKETVVLTSKAGLMDLIQHLRGKPLMLKSAFRIETENVDILTQQK